jgi:hypothetical protein
MLDEPPHETFNVTQSYALFTAIVCWVVHQMRDKKNEAAVKFLTKLSSEQIDKKPWARVGAAPVDVPHRTGLSFWLAVSFKLIHVNAAMQHICLLWIIESADDSKCNQWSKNVRSRLAVARQASALKMNSGMH